MARSKRPPRVTAVQKAATAATLTAAAADPLIDPALVDAPGPANVDFQIVGGRAIGGDDGPDPKRPRKRTYENAAAPVYRTPRARAQQKFKDNHENWVRDKRIALASGARFVVKEPVLPKVRRLAAGSRCIPVRTGND